jgi:hypothetical protein
MPNLDENVLAEILSEVLEEDLMLNGDALLEEILDDDEEPPEQPEEPVIPPQPEPEMYLPPPPTREGEPDRPTDEEVAQLRREAEAIQASKAHLDSERGWAENAESRRCPSRQHGIWDAEQCNYECWRFEAPQFRLRVRVFQDIVGAHNARLQQYQQRFEAFKRKAENWERWRQEFDRKVDEYNAIGRRERERVEREQNHWQEEVRHELERYEREMREYHEALARFQQEQEQKQQQRLQEAERVLESKASKLLDRAQHQVQQASMFPLPMVPSPSRPGGRPRSDSPPPLNDTWIRQAEAKLRVGDHQNTIRTSVRRMLRDGCGLSQRTAQNMGDSAEYAVDAAVAYFLGGLSKVGKAAGFASQVIKTAAKRAVGKVEVKMREPRHIPEDQRGEINHHRERDRGHFSRAEAEGSGLHYTPNHPPRNPRLTSEFRQETHDAVDRLHSGNMEVRNHLHNRINHSDVDHRIPLGLGGNDIRNNLTFKNRILNRSEGGQLGNQLRGAQEGAQVHVRFE